MNFNCGATQSRKLAKSALAFIMHVSATMRHNATDKPFDIVQRTFEFARDVLKAYPPAARWHPPSAQAWRQLISAATSVGANVEETRAASSRPDFRSRFKIALREARESYYWLRLIRAGNLVSSPAVPLLEQEASEIVAILTTIAKRTNPPGTSPPTVR